MFGAILVGVVLFLPAGLLPTIEEAWRKRHPVQTEYTNQAGALSHHTAAVVGERTEPRAEAAGRTRCSRSRAPPSGSADSPRSTAPTSPWSAARSPR